MPKSRTTKPAPSRPRSVAEIADRIAAPTLDPREAYMNTFEAPAEDFGALEEAVRAMHGDATPDLETLVPDSVFPNFDAKWAFDSARLSELEVAREMGFWVGYCIGRRLAGGGR